MLRWAWESGVTVLGMERRITSVRPQILQQCADQRLSYFDGLLMAVAELREVTEVMTVDGSHFGGVRLAHAPTITIV